MATKTHTTTIITDDIDGTEGAETTTFALHGVTYEIDLNEKNVAKLEKALSPFLDAARKPSKKRGRTAKSDGPSAKDIREWAASQKIEVPARGRIPLEVRDAYTAAH